MRKSSIQTIEAAASVLNRHIAENTPEGKVLAGDGRAVVLGVVNEILAEAAEGGRLLAAVESDGQLLGFVPRMNVPIPEIGGTLPTPPPASPDEEP